MKFYKATLYKVPFDSSYKNVVDYRSYVAESNVITGVNDIEISAIQNSFFSNLPSLVVLPESDTYKSVKTSGRTLVLSVYGIYENICEYNYLILQGSNSKLFCFIDSMDSNNDSSNASTMLYCTIDYWNTYIEQIYAMPAQFAEYQHEYMNINNSNNDDRVPSSFKYMKKYQSLFDKVIIWLKIRLDRTGYDIISDAETLSFRYMWDGSASGYITGYIPIAFIENTADNFTITPINGYFATNYDSGEADEVNDYIYTEVTQHLVSQYLIDATITFITPSGIFYKDNYIYNNGVINYFKVSKLYSYTAGNVNKVICTLAKNSEQLIGENVEVSGNYTFGVSTPFIFYSNTQRNFSIFSATTKETATIINSIPTISNSINASFSPNNETNLYKSPYSRKNLKLFSQNFDVTPKVSGSTTKLDSKLSFQSWFNVSMLFESVLNSDHNTKYFLEDIEPIAIPNNATYTTSVDKLAAYLQTSSLANTMKFVASEIGLTGAAIAGSFVSPVAVVGAGAGMLSAATNFVSQRLLAERTPDQFTNPSFNAADAFYTAFPIIEEDTLLQRDKNILADYWHKYGHIIMNKQSFSAIRFYFDYKKYRDTCIPGITNPIARRVIETIFNNGVTIWHCNSVRNVNLRDPVGTIYYPNIYDYTKNNPDAIGASTV